MGLVRADRLSVFVDVQRAFDRYLRHGSARSLREDRVHPNATGHMIIATELLHAIGFDWNHARPEAKMSSGCDRLRAPERSPD